MVSHCRSILYCCAQPEQSSKQHSLLFIFYILFWCTLPLKTGDGVLKIVVVLTCLQREVVAAAIMPAIEPHYVQETYGVFHIMCSLF